MRYLLHLTLICCILFSNLAFSQTPGRVLIKGSLQDTLKEPVLFATVMLLNPKDSTLVSFTTSNDKGNFQFPYVKNSNYLLKVQHISYIPLQKMLHTSSTEQVSLGVLAMKPMSKELIEVVVKQAKAPLKIRGDTVEYDASTFKIPPGSTVEDLLRRLPGIDVDADGNIKTQGKDVKRMYVDGKTFFGNDPKAVTKNLGAEAISKVQVFNEKSEQSKLTGIDDGAKEKAMNLELKQEYKKGSFGKLTGALGTEDRWASRGNYNRFNDKIQLSFIGYGNNINQTGVNWEDYSEFKGNNSFNEYDNGDFGFGGGRMFYFMGGDDSPMGYYDGRGLTKNFGGGTNLNYTTKKKKFSGSYFYNQTDLDFLQQSFRQTFLDNNQQFNKSDTLRHNEFRSSHSIGARYEAEPDSSNRIILKANLRYSNNNNEQNQIQDFEYINSTQPSNILNLNNSSTQGNFRFSTTAIYRHLFKKKGRSFAVSGAYNLNLGEGTRIQNSLNIVNLPGIASKDIRKSIENDANTDEFKSSALFTEPLSKKWFFEVFYNFNQVNNLNNTQTHNPLAGNVRIDTLSLYSEQLTLKNRLGSSFRYSFNGLNGSVGVAAQELGLNGKYATGKGEPWKQESIDYNYFNAIPYLDINYELKNNVRLSCSYSKNVQAPQYTDLIPLKNTGNPAYVVEGNLDLTPEKEHNFSTSVSYWNQASFMYISGYLDYTITEDPIIYNQQTRFVPGTGVVTVSRPENMNNSQSYSSYISSNFPIIKTKLSVGLSLSNMHRNSETSINNFIDKLTTDNYRFSPRISITPNQKLACSLGGSLSYSNYAYNEKNQFDQKFNNLSANADLKWQIIKKLFLESNFRYMSYNNSKLAYNQSIPLWNASFRYLLGKKNKFELRAAAFDIFNKNKTINQAAMLNYIEYSTTNTLARYYMLSLTYNMKGFETKLSKNNFF